ncbi:uncharacterized protein fid isoform X1 [Euwallacea fornicatus]|uniref:uncharacterized protein fid isoform X1 n=1 Tax=Euwallacea fornicatus TaxID=995702 RepID=UPI00338D8E41
MAANERISRSFALEQTYVHEVYEQYYDNPHSKPWPKVQEFLEKLEPGALVCDVGCGNGKYLKVNKSIYNLGGEKSIRLSDLARQNQNEVIRLDNLALPFRDNSFDTVLSLSVIHHFATTDRRVSALREMTRILRVGGRMIITVWAMEQDHRKFESQDVLVPWRRPKLRNACDISSSTNSEDEILHPYHSYSQEDSESNKSFKFRNTFKRRSRTNKQRAMDPYRKTSSGSSSLSSPSETCYGFVRRALQKIAGGGRRVVANSWFLDNWIACMHKQQPLHKRYRRYDPDGCEYCECSGCDNVEDQPIELLRIDDEEPKQISRRQTCPVSQMSADIDAFKSKSMNNIRSSTPENNNNRCKLSKKQQDTQGKDVSEKPLILLSKSTLKKPKLVKQKKSLCDEDAEEALDQPTDMKDLVRALPDFKSSLSRYDRGGVLKQRSLNEEILSTDRLREKERLKKNIQKQTSLNEDLIYKRTNTFESIRESFFAVASSKGFQLFKNGLTNRIKNSTTMEKVTNASLKNGFVKIFQTWKGGELKSPTSRDNEGIKLFIPTCQVSEQPERTTERRHSKEDGSDSSKDSSLQSDTSVDSEDSFASVIFVPKSDPMSPIGGPSFSAGPTSPLLKGGCQSAPQSPRIKQSSCPTSPRVKQIPNGMHPLIKQLSSPKPSTELLSTAAAFFPCDKDRLKPAKLLPMQPIIKRENIKVLAQKYTVAPIPQFRRTTLNTPCGHNTESISVPITKVTSPDQSPPDCSEASRAEKLRTIREMLAQKPEFGVKSKARCPIVKKISDPTNKQQSLVKSIPKLMKLEIFNPVEDDDSDNSCVSSPDSMESVKITVPSLGNEGEKFHFPDATANQKALLETSTNVATSFDEPLEKVINSKPKKKLPSVDVFSILHKRFSSSDVTPLLDEDEDLNYGESRRSSSTWNEECQRHLTAFADKLSEKLMKELDEYQITMDNIDDPYIHRLSEELHDLSILSEEIKKQNEYLTRLSHKKNNCDFVACSPDRTKNHQNTRLINEVLPCVNNTSVKRFSVNSNVPKYEEGFNGKKLESYPFCCTDGEQSERNGDSLEIGDGNRRDDESRPLMGKESSSSESFDSSDKGSSSNSLLSSGATSINFGGQSIASSVTDLTGESRDGCSNGGSTASLVSIESKGKNKLDNTDTLSPGHMKRRDPSGLSDISADSWPPDEIGGDITYHRYYHVFRQGELEKLIEKYVDDLHVVSSTYEHASWCIIAEKVQIWTI